MRKGYIGLTDPDWYKFLSDHPRVDEVNFWQPHGNRIFRAVNPNEPFFFKLRAPYKKIAGFGFFERYEILPPWLAWESFGEMNGALDFDSMVDRIIRLRGEGEPRASDFKIGCVMIKAPLFFSPEEWVDPPVDWAKTGIQQGKTYPMDTGEGRRVFLDCIERAKTSAHYWNVDRIAEDSPRYGSPVLVAPRLGQGLFSLAVRDAYQGACAVTGEHSAPVLEAAHIMPYSRGGRHVVENGILLRSDLHRLYDRGYVTVTSEYEFHVGERLRREFNNGRSYYGLEGKRIQLPKQAESLPNREHLEWHKNEVFLG
jgi:putative restriction endonuclease